MENKHYQSNIINLLQARECGTLLSRKRRCYLYNNQNRLDEIKISKPNFSSEKKKINNKYLMDEIMPHGINRSQIGGFSNAQCVMLSNR